MALGDGSENSEPSFCLTIGKRLNTKPTRLTAKSRRTSPSQQRGGGQNQTVRVLTDLADLDVGQRLGIDTATLPYPHGQHHAVLAAPLLSAACAAASRAIGTRNGEHET